MENRRFISCSVCGTALVGSSPLVNPACYKCRTSVQVNSWNSRTHTSRSGNLSWKSISSHEQDEDAAAGDGRKTPETENRRFLPPPPGRSLVGAEGRAGRNHSQPLPQFESTMDGLAVHADRSLKMATSDSEISKVTQSFFSSCQSVVSSEDTIDGDDTSSWNGDCPGSPHSSASGSYEPSISSEDTGYLSRSGGVSRRTRRTKRVGGLAGKVPTGEPNFDAGAGGDGDKSASSSRELPENRSYTSGSLAGSSGNGSHAREPSSSSSWGSGDLSRYNAWTGSGNGNSSGHAYNSSSSGDLSRLAEIRASQYRSGSKSPQVIMSRQLINGEGSSGRASLDGLQEVNPYGALNSASSPQASPSPHFPSPAPSHHNQANSSASRSIHCCMHCRSKTCNVFQLLPENMCCTNGDCTLCSHSCCQPPTITNSGQLPQCHGKPNPFIASTRFIDAQVQDAGGMALKAMEKKKRHLKQVMGGAGFFMCYECEEILQIPENLHVSRSRPNRLRCGGCCAVVEYMLVDKTRIVPYKFAINRKIVTGEGVDGRPVPNSYAASPASGDGSSNHSRRDQISYTENYSGYSDGGGGGGGGSTEGTSCIRRSNDER